jgi:MOSC domain-containing protein YiiM
LSGASAATGAGACVAAVSARPEHGVGKTPRPSITLVAGLGVDGDAHLGELVQHRSRARRNPLLANLRQVHLIGEELLHELRARGFDVAAGAMGENVTTRGVDLLGLPAGTRLRLGSAATVELTGLRNPCRQLEGIQAGLMAATIDRDEHGGLIRRAGVMAIVVRGGEVRPGDAIAVELPAGPHRRLEPV